MFFNNLFDTPLIQRFQLLSVGISRFLGRKKVQNLDEHLKTAHSISCLAKTTKTKTSGGLMCCVVVFWGEMLCFITPKMGVR